MAFIPGRSYHLGGKTGLLLGGTKSSEFTAAFLARAREVKFFEFGCRPSSRILPCAKELDLGDCFRFATPYHIEVPCACLEMSHLMIFLTTSKAVIYIKLQGSDNAQEETVMLKEGRARPMNAFVLDDIS